MSLFIRSNANLTPADREEKQAERLMPSGRKPGNKGKKKKFSGRSGPRPAQRRIRMNIPDSDVVNPRSVSYDKDMSLSNRYSFFHNAAAPRLTEADYESLMQAINDIKDTHSVSKKILTGLVIVLRSYFDLEKECRKLDSKWGPRLIDKMNSDLMTDPLFPKMSEYFELIDGLKNNVTDVVDDPWLTDFAKNGHKEIKIGGKIYKVAVMKKKAELLDKLCKQNIDVIKRPPEEIRTAIGGERKDLGRIVDSVTELFVQHINPVKIDTLSRYGYFGVVLKRLEESMSLSTYNTKLVDFYIENLELESIDATDYAKKLKEVLEELKEGTFEISVADVKLSGDFFRLTFYKRLYGLLKKTLNSNEIKLEKGSFTTVINKVKEENKKEFKNLFVQKLLQEFKSLMKEMDSDSFDKIMEGYGEEPSVGMGDVASLINKYHKKLDNSKFKARKDSKQLSREELDKKYQKFYQELQQKFDPDLDPESKEELPRLSSSFKRFRNFQSSYEDYELEMKNHRLHTATYHGVLHQGHPDGPTNTGWNSLDKRYIDESHLERIILSAKKMLKDNSWFQFNWKGGSNDAPYRAALDLAIYTSDNNNYQSKIDAPTYERLLNKLASWNYDTLEDTVLNMPKNPRKRNASSIRAVLSELEKCEDALNKIK